MIKTIFRNTFLVGLSVLILCAGLFFAVRYTQTINDAYDVLRQETEYIAAGLMEQGTGYLEQLGNENRITWIAADGTVLFDNQFGTDLDNQLGGSEVADALDTGSGNVIRQSESSSLQTMYYALKCQDGTVLRLSRPLSAVQNALNFISPAIWILVIVLLISGILSYRAARQIVKPINEIDLENPDMSEYPELSPLINKIQEQKLTIQDESLSREQMRREFTANISHELKTPLTSISGFAELMSNTDVPDDKMREFAGDIYRESQRLIVLINDIIKLSQLDENAFENTFEEVDVYGVCTDVVEALANTAEKSGIRIYLTGESTFIHAVRPVLFEMIYNLCDNAVKYNRIQGKVNMDVTSDDQSVTVSVSDTGIGIPKEHIDRIFERFYRVDKSHSRAIGGTGLGLSIVKHGAMIHDAEVTIDSVPDEGTTIKLRFRKS